MVFDFFFYAATIVATLTVYGLVHRSDRPSTQPIASSPSIPAPEAIATALEAVDSEWLSWESDLAAMDNLLEVEPEPTPAPVSMTDVVVPFVRPVRPQTPNWAQMGAPELRKVCQRAGIKWRNAHGKGKHLSKREMVNALTSQVAV